MSLRAKFSYCALVVAFCCSALPSRIGMAEEILTNQEVVKMVSAGLGEDVIVAKVREAPQVDFQLSVDDLVALRKAGLSDRVVAAMLERSKRVHQNPAHQGPPNDVSLKTADRTLTLRMVHGKVSSAGFGWTSNVFMNYPGLRSPVRIHDHRPVLLVTCPSAPEVGQYFLAKLDPDKRNEVRSLKLGQAVRKRAAPGGRLAPDADWIIPFVVSKEENPGTWRVMVEQELKPGEYGWYVNLPDIEDMSAVLSMSKNCFEGGGLFDFGID